MRESCPNLGDAIFTGDSLDRNVLNTEEQVMSTSTVPAVILSALTERKIQIGEPKIRHGKNILEIAYTKMEYAEDLETATPVFDVISVIKPEAKPRKPRTAKQAKPAKK